MLRRAAGVLVIVCAVTAPARGQDEDHSAHQHHHEMPMPEPAPSWTWQADANVFIGYDYQKRHFADFSSFESQNWGMLSGERPVGPGRLTISGMLSLEPFTIPAEGSPQLFQTGESYQSIPLVNRQHPHDLFMELGASYRIPRGKVTYSLSGGLVGAPALGPTAFMHRESARDNPQAPLTHHMMDSTHVTPGVITAGIDTGAFRVEASAFRGEEPDENRTDIDQPRLNSFSGRVSWRRGPWDAQFSAGRLHQPEWFEPYDETRITASLGFNGTLASRRLSATLAWGENREDFIPNGVADGELLEWDYQLTPRTALYGRGEIAVKQVLGLGYHPRADVHPHYYSHVDALTVGVVRDIPTTRWTRIGVGADVTLYHMSPDMLTYYAGSRSFHVFVRIRPNVAPAAHVH